MHVIIELHHSLPPHSCPQVLAKNDPKKFDIGLLFSLTITKKHDYYYFKKDRKIL